MVFETHPVLVAGSKRTATEENEASQKRLRISKSIATPEHLSSEEDGTDDDSKETVSANPRAAPLTPVSPRRRFPSEQKTHHCTYDGCQKSFNRPARLADHLRSHNNERPFKCPYESCDKAFLRDTHLSHHVKSAHTGIREYSCQWPECGKSFLTATRLRRHQAVHEGKEKYQCTDYAPCDETFRKHSTLQRHIISVHLHQKPFQCPQDDPVTGSKCSQAFDSAGKLRAHEGRIHGGLRFWCTECSAASTRTDGGTYTSPPSTVNGVGFPTYAILQSHLRAVHPPTCATCQKTCATRGELRQHIELHHADAQQEQRTTRPHNCPHADCGKSFTKKGNLTVHQRTVHSATRPYSCSRDADLSSSRDCAAWDPAVDACGQTFKTKATLEEHVRNVHLHLATRASSKSRSRRRTSSNTNENDGNNIINPNRPHKSRTANPSSTSTIDRLTGAEYTSNSHRPILCFLAGSGTAGTTCPHRFARDYDLDVHMRSRHGLADQEIAALRAEREMLNGGKFWLGGADDEEEEDDFGPYIDTSDAEEDAFDRFLMAAEDGGGDGARLRGVGDGEEGGGEAVIDPALLALHS